MGTPHEYAVTLEEQEGGPEAELRERWATCVARRMRILDEDEGFYPEAGTDFEILDGFEGPFIWELTDEELEANPPSAVYLEIASVTPETPAPAPSPEPVQVVVRVVF